MIFKKILWNTLPHNLGLLLHKYQYILQIQIFKDIEVSQYILKSKPSLRVIEDQQ